MLQAHRGLMLLAVGLVCVAFTLPFLYRGGWSQRAGCHPYMGCTVLALCVLQPIMAVLRPAPHSPRRYLFNLGHRITGTLVQIVAVLCIYQGFQQQALLVSGPGATGALVGWLLWILLSDLGLQFSTMSSSASVSKGIVVGEDQENMLFVNSDKPGQPEGYEFKKMVMIVFQIGNVLFLGILMNAIIYV